MAIRKYHRVKKPRVYLRVWEINALGHPVLTQAQIVYLMTRGNWIINAGLEETPIDREVGGLDASIYAGQGVIDLDRVEKLMNQFPWGKFAVDVGGPDSWSEYVYIGTNDMQAMRSTFIGFWGTVNRPKYWEKDIQTIEISGSEVTKWP